MVRLHGDGGFPNGAGDASRVTIAEPYCAGVPLRSVALRTTDASPLRVPLSCVFGQTILSCDNCPTEWCLRAAAFDCASDDGCIGPTGAGVFGRGNPWNR